MRGETGSGKTTLLRGLGVGVVCPNQIGYENLVGSVDFEASLKQDKLIHKGALLKVADGRALILDQLHLFNRSVISTIISAQQNGSFIVERSGFSKTITTNFAILAALSPSESTLPAAVSDDFGIIVDLDIINDIRARSAIVNTALKSRAELAEYYADDEKLRKSIARAKIALKSVIMPFTLQLEAAKMLENYHFGGNHLDVKIVETALAIAACEGHAIVEPQDLAEAAELVLYGRRQQSESPQSETPQRQDESDDQPNADNSPEQNQDQTEAESESEAQDDSPLPDIDTQQNVDSNDQITTEAIGQGIDFTVGVEKHRIREQIIGLGKREKRIGKDRHGHAVFYRSTDKYDDIDIFGTILKAAPRQSARRKANTVNDDVRLIVKKSDLQRKVREHRIGNTLIFVLDASGSLRANKRMEALKGTIFNVLTEAYVKRDKVALIAFRDGDVDLALPITGSVDLANKRLRELPSGGNSPIADALSYAKRYIQSNQIKSRESKYVLIFLSDGRANASSFGDAPIDDAKKVAKALATLNVKKVFIDYESGRIKLGLMQQLAELAGAELIKVDALSEKELTETVRAIK